MFLIIMICGQSVDASVLLKLDSQPCRSARSYCITLQYTASLAMLYGACQCLATGKASWLGANFVRTTIEGSQEVIDVEMLRQTMLVC